MNMREKERERECLCGITWCYCPLGIAEICSSSSFALFLCITVCMSFRVYSTQSPTPSATPMTLSFYVQDLFFFFFFFCPLFIYFSLFPRNIGELGMGWSWVSSKTFLTSYGSFLVPIG
jgi:hypothetical protein